MARSIYSMTLTLAGAMLASVSAIPSAALAASVNVDEASEIPVRIVSYRDLNLTSPAGTRTLQGRLRVAARNVCADSGWDHGSRAASAGFSKCQASALAVAQPQMLAAAKRAQDLASTGQSLVAAGAITLSAQK